MKKPDIEAIPAIVLTAFLGLFLFKAIAEVFYIQADLSWIKVTSPLWVWVIFSYIKFKINTIRYKRYKKKAKNREE